MKRICFVVLTAIVAATSALTVAQGNADLSGRWTLDINRSDRSIQANEPRVAFPTVITIKQTAGEVDVETASTRQDPIKVTYKLDGPEMTVPGPSGITLKTMARMDGDKLVVTTKRSFSSPAGEVTADIQETYSVSEGSLTLEKRQVISGETAALKAIYRKTS